MTIQYSVTLLEHFIVPGISKFDRAAIPDLREIYDQHPHWLTNHFLNSSFSANFKPPMRQYAFNIIYRTQMSFKDYHEARELTALYLSVTTRGNPTIRQYFEALSRWESCFLNWQILVDVFNKMAETKEFKNGDGSPDQRAYDISTAVKHCGGKIHEGLHDDNLTVPLWLENDGFHSKDYLVSYAEFGSLIAQAAQLADDIQDPRTFLRNTMQDARKLTNSVCLLSVHL